MTSLISNNFETTGPQIAETFLHVWSSNVYLKASKNVKCISVALMNCTVAFGSKSLLVLFMSRCEKTSLWGF